jgi:hypothetical protein
MQDNSFVSSIVALTTSCVLWDVRRQVGETSRRMNKRPMKKTVGTFETSLLMLFYFKFFIPFPSINAKSSGFTVSQHQSRKMKWVENG